MLNVSTFYNKLVQTVYSEDMDFQEAILRGVSEELRGISYETLVKFRCFYVPDDFYLLSLTDGEAESPAYGLYIGNKCIFRERLVIPVVDFMGDIVGFCGHSDGGDLPEDQQYANVKYVYSSKEIFDKGRHMLMLPETYRKALEEQYIAIVDGSFDSIHLYDVDCNATSLLSSSVSAEHLYYLKFIKNWVVICDNDRAGIQLYDYLKMQNPNTCRISFSGTKDIDEKLREPDGKEKLLTALKECKECGYILDIDMDRMYNGDLRRTTKQKDLIEVTSNFNRDI